MTSKSLSKHHYCHHIPAPEKLRMLGMGGRAGGWGPVSSDQNFIFLKFVVMGF